MAAVVAPRLALATLSNWLCAFQSVFRAHGHTHVRVGGGGARALLDGCTDGLRDVDLFLDGEAQGGRRDALLAIARDLAGAGVVRADLRPPRPKRRARPDRAHHVIGEGMHMYPPASPLPIVSLTLLTHRDELQHNGLFDIDTVLVVLDTVRPMRVQMRSPAIEDPHAGYAAWQARRPAVVHWDEVARCHARHGLRLARTIAACGHDDLESPLAAGYHARRPLDGGVDDPDEAIRDVVKTLGCEAWQTALRLARRLAPFAGDPAFAWLLQALLAFDGGLDTPSLTTRARQFLRPLGSAADGPLARISAAVPGVFPFLAGDAR